MCSLVCFALTSAAFATGSSDTVSPQPAASRAIAAMGRSSQAARRRMRSTYERDQWERPLLGGCCQEAVDDPAEVEAFAGARYARVGVDRKPPLQVDQDVGITARKLRCA